jgi:hypothetical protein
MIPAFSTSAAMFDLDYFGGVLLDFCRRTPAPELPHDLVAIVVGIAV